MGNYKFILSGGGTGGHIYPAVAIANELKLRHPDADILFVGAKDRMEMEKVPQAGYKIEGLWISGIQRKLTLKNLLFPFKLISSLLKARKIVKSFKPDLVVGTGGFASGPLIKSAAMLGVPSVLQEQNSFAGITNKWLASKAEKICVAYKGMDAFFPENKIEITGNPVRANILEEGASKEDAISYFGLDPKKKVVLIIGGSLGAKRINEIIADKLGFFKNQDVQLLWQCGKIYYESYKELSTKSVVVKDFILDMGKAYAAADMVISRAGAGSVSELCVVGKAVIFIPSPNVAEDHQTKNAQALVNEQAAIMIEEENLSSEFESQFLDVLNSEEKQTLLAANIKKMALPNATKDIVNEIEKILVKNS